jgi:hypothetical protein
MIGVSKCVKSITTKATAALIIDYEHFPPLSAMCVFNFLCMTLPLLVLVPQCATPMPEFNSLVAASQA